MSQLRHKVARVDGEILAAVRAQSSSGGRARGDLAAARATIEDLFGKIREIQRKAEQSELMVQVRGGFVRAELVFWPLQRSARSYGW